MANVMGNKSTANAVLLLDCSFDTEKEFSKIIKIESKTSKGKKPFEFRKPVISSCIEGMIEYARIVFDLFPIQAIPSIRLPADEQPKVSIIFPQSTSKLKVNTFTTEGFEYSTPQCSREILKDMANECKEASYVPNNFRESIKNIAKSIQGDKPSTLHQMKPHRILCILQPNDLCTPASHSYSYFARERESGEVKEEISIPHVLYTEIYRQRKKLDQRLCKEQHCEYQLSDTEQNVNEIIRSCEIVIIRLVKNGNQSNFFIPPKIVNSFRTEVHWVDLDNFVDVMQDLASIHYHLKSLRITGIPMKKDNARTNYDVVLLYPSDSHLTSGSYEDFLPLGSHRCLTENELKLQWKTTEKGYDVSSLDCTCVHRLTPLSISSSPSRCLTRFLLNKRPAVFLIPMNFKETDSKQYTSHLVLQQGNQMYLHCLTPSFYYEEELMVKLFGYYTNNDVDIRVNSFISIMESNKLFPSPPSYEKQPLALCPPLIPDQNNNNKPQSTSSLDPSSLDTQSIDNSTSFHAIKVFTTWDIMRKTMSFPYRSSDSILCGNNLSSELSRLLVPLKNYLEQPELLDKAAIDHGIDILKRLYQAQQINDSSLFPSNTKRKENYQLLWKEILTLAQRSCLIHPGSPTPLLDHIKKWYDLPSDQTKSSNTNSISSPSMNNNNMNIDDNLENTWKDMEKNRRQFELGTYVNSDLTHQGSSLDEENKRKSDFKRNDPLDQADSASLFHKFWAKETEKIPASKFVL